MQALSHRSYHKTGCQLALCDLQGGIYSDCAVLTDAAILSRTPAYGVTDLGPDGIDNFFTHHKVSQDLNHIPLFGSLELFCRTFHRVPYIFVKLVQQVLWRLSGNAISCSFDDDDDDVASHS